MISVHNRKLIDIETAFRAIPLVGTDARFTGSVPDNGGFSTHLQGLAAHEDVHLLTHSDEGTPAGRIFIVDRRPGERRLLGTFDLPVVSPTEPFYFHAGGCQLVGDCLAVPCETGENRSVVAFFDVSVTTAHASELVSQLNNKAQLTGHFVSYAIRDATICR